MRPAQVGHADAIAAVHVAAWQHAYQGMLPPELLASISVASRAQRWRQLTHAQGAHTWVVGEPVRGVVSVGPSRDDDAADDIRAAVLDEVRYRLERVRAAD